MHITLLALPTASPLNLFGPAEIFAEANRCLRSTEPAYQVQVVTSGHHYQATSFYGALASHPVYSDCESAADTLLVVGGSESADPGVCRQLIDWLTERCRHTRRVAGICSGVGALAEAGLLNGRRATTHWTIYETVSGKYPRVEFLPDRVFVRDGSWYTSAGGAAAVDLALSLVSDDLGEDVASEIARRMVVFLRRSETHPQLSATVQVQTYRNDKIGELLAWMADHVEQDLSVAELARRVAMSPRNFSRHFFREVGKTPAKHVMDLRLEAAKNHLANGTLALKEVSYLTGLKNTETLRRAFRRSLGLSVAEYRDKLNHGS
jgi:transcriptional regulator GlxA family with amidase domain